MAARLCTTLGLRDPMQSLVKRMYKDDMGAIIERHAQLGRDGPTASADLEAETDALCEEHGPVVWSSAPSRPWLYNLGEGGEKTSDVHTTQLYWADLQHRELIKSKMLQLVRYRVRKRRTKVNQERRSSAHRNSTALDRPIPCFGTFKHGRFSHAVLDELKKHKVWLGNGNDEEEPVAGETFRAVTQRLLKYTVPGATQDRSCEDSPWVTFNCPDKTVHKVACGGCGATVFDDTADGATPMTVKLETINIDRDDASRSDQSVAEHEIDGNELEANAWFFNITCGPEKAFAFVRREKGQYWHFWMQEGGYGSELCLKTVVEEEDHPKVGPPAALRSTQPLTDLRRLVSESGQKRARTLSESEYAPSERSPSCISAGHTSGRPQRSRVTDQTSTEKERLLSAFDEGDEEQRPARRQKRGQSETDSLYRVTPGLQEKRGFRAINGASSPAQDVGNGDPSAQNEESESTLPASAFAAASRQTQPPRSDPAPADDTSQGNDGTTTMEPPALRRRILMWLYVGGASGRNAVYLDDSMSVHRVFELFREKLQRQLKGKGRSLEAVAIGIPGVDEEKINLEVDDKDGWEAVQEIVREAGVKTVYGNVISSEGGDWENQPE